MSSHAAAKFGYRIREEGGAWRWTVYDRAGQIATEGLSVSRAAAAAQVIQALAEDSLRAMPDAA